MPVKNAILIWSTIDRCKSCASVYSSAVHPADNGPRLASSRHIKGQRPTINLEHSTARQPMPFDSSIGGQFIGCLERKQKVPCGFHVIPSPTCSPFLRVFPWFSGQPDCSCFRQSMQPHLPTKIGNQLPRIPRRPFVILFSSVAILTGTTPPPENEMAANVNRSPNWRHLRFLLFWHPPKAHLFSAVKG